MNEQQDPTTITPAPEPTGKWRFMQTEGFVYPTTTPKEEQETEETEAEEIEGEYFVSYVTIPESKVCALINKSNGKYIIRLEGGADGWEGTAATIEEAQKIGEQLLAEYESFET